MKVLLLSSEFPPGPGGIGTHAYELARGLHRLGHEVEVIAPQDYVSTEAADAFRASLPFRFIRTARTQGSLHRAVNSVTVRRRLHSFDPDIFVASGGGAVAAAALLAGHRPWIAVAHGTEIHAGRPLTRALIRRSFRRAACVISVSRYTAAQLLGAEVLPARTEVIHNGADPTLETLAVTAAPLADLVPSIAGHPVILTVGNVTERKGQEVVVRAMPAVLAEVPDAHYVLVGLPTDGPKMQALALELGVADRVHLTGPLPTADLAGALRDATILAMTSRHTSSGDFEGFGIAVIEAALLGTPAVVSDSGGLPEAVVDGQTGIVVPENDVAATAGAIIELLRRPELVARLGRNAQARAHGELVWPEVIGRYEAVIRTVVDTGVEPPPDRSADPGPAGDDAPDRVDLRPQRRLVFISDTPHYLVDGTPLGWAATVREIDVLSQLFDEIVHITPLYTGMDEFAMAPYRASNVVVRFLHQAGGDNLRDKLGVFLALRSWSQAIGDELRRDPDAIVHVRGPSSVALFAVLRAAVRRDRPIHWFKYAGNWQPNADLDYDAWSYRLQRWILRRVHRGPVTVNGRWPDQPRLVRTFINPTYTSEELQIAQALVADKRLEDEIRLLFVGRLSPTKGPLRVLEMANRLLQQGIRVRLDIVGDGTQRAELVHAIEADGLADLVTLHGWVKREDLAPIYAAAHLLLLPSTSEGFPKVISEAMSYGAIPLAGAVSSIPQILADLGVGRSLPGDDVDAYVNVILEYIRDPDRWQRESELCICSAQNFSFDTYLANVVRLFHDFWSLELTPRVARPASPEG